MMSTLLGKENSVRERMNISAVMMDKPITVEDWVAALSAGSGVDLSAFLTWYNQPGTQSLKRKVNMMQQRKLIV